MNTYAYQSDGTVTIVNNNFTISTDQFEASKRIAAAEFGDKTFCLLIILTIIWSSRNKDESENKDNIEKRSESRSPFRMIVVSSIGTILTNVHSILYQENIWANKIRLSVAIILVVTLCNYMFGICAHNFSREAINNRKAKKEYENKELTRELKDKAVE